MLECLPFYIHRDQDMIAVLRREKVMKLCTVWPCGWQRGVTDHPLTLLFP